MTLVGGLVLCDRYYSGGRNDYKGKIKLFVSLFIYTLCWFLFTCLIIVSNEVGTQGSTAFFEF
jgi:hypothetical protein